jgi:hypothetical protein
MIGLRGAVLRASLMLGVAVFSAPAFAADACVLVGTKDVDGNQNPTYHCGTDFVFAQVVSDATLTITNLSTGSSANGPGVHFKSNDTSGDAHDLTLNLEGTTSIVAPTYDGVDMRTRYGDMTVNIGAGVVIAPDQTGLHIESDAGNLENGKYAGGDVTITNYGTVNAGAHTDPMGADGIAGLANAGSVHIYNYGTVTTSYDPGNANAPATGRGILADGGYNSSNVVEVAIYNDGSVSSIHDGLRVNSYNGLGKVVNDVNGVVTSTDRRGVVVWSAANAALFENYGSVTALDGPGANVWAEGTVTGDATLINSGSITSYDNPTRTGSDSVFSGVHIWSEVIGDANLTNRAGGSIIAHDGWGAWMQSTDGDVSIDNAGLIKGETTAIYVGADQIKELTTVPLPDYQGAMGGDLKLSNSGLLTAFSTGNNAKFGVVTLEGDVTDLSLRNLAGGIIGAGIDLSDGFDTTLLTASAVSRSGVAEAAANSAILVAARADTTEIDNQGTIIGRITLDTPASLWDDGDLPDSTGTRSIDNSGLWVTRGTSGFNGLSSADEIFNSGTIWALGSTEFNADLVNDGNVVVAGLTGEAGHLTIDGNYSVDDGTFGIVIDNGAMVDSTPVINILGGVHGAGKIDLVDLSGWDWQQDATLDLVHAQSSEDGAASFSLAQPDLGLLHYALNYDDTDGELWSITAGISTQSTTQIGDVVAATTAGFDRLTLDMLSRTDDLRDQFGTDDTAPMGYAAAPTNPAQQAIAGLDGKPQALRVWSKAVGAVGGGDGYDANFGGVEVGADASTSLPNGALAAGVFGALTKGNLGFDDIAGSSSTSTSWAGGGYATYLDQNGVFVSGVAGIETADIDLSISGASANIDALTFGGRVDLGYRTHVGELQVEPSVGIKASSSSIDGFEMSGLSASFSDPSLFAAEARLRVERTFVTETYDITPFATVSLGNQTGDSSLAIAGFDDTATDLSGLYGGLAAGVAVDSADGKWSTYARGDVVGNDDSWLATFRLGGAYRF